MHIHKRESRVFVTAALMLAMTGCPSGDDTVLVSGGDGFVRLLAADADHFYFTRRDDAGGVLYRGSLTGGPHTVLAAGVGGWLSGEGVVHDGYLYYSDGDLLSRIPTTGGDLEPMAGPGGIAGLAAAGRTVYIQHAGGLGALDVDTGELTSLYATDSAWWSRGLTVFAGHLVWSNGASLVAKDLAASDGTAVVVDRSTDCPEEEACSFQDLDLVGATDEGILFIEYTFSRYDTGDRWSNGDPRWALRTDRGALYALAFAADGEASIQLIEDDIVLAAVRDGALWGVRLGGEVVGIEPAQALGRSIDIDDEFLADDEFHPRLLATTTHLVFPSTDDSIRGIELR
jgi:hypothetical protein